MKSNIFFKLYIYVSNDLNKDEDMLAAFCTNKEDNGSCFKLTNSGSKNEINNIFSFSQNTSLISASSDGGADVCSFYSGPSDAAILAFGESYEGCGSIAYDGESCGSIAFSGSGESCGSIASSGGSSFSGGGCSYSC